MCASAQLYRVILPFLTLGIGQNSVRGRPHDDDSHWIGIRIAKGRPKAIDALRSGKGNVLGEDFQIFADDIVAKIFNCLELPVSQGLLYLLALAMRGYYLAREVESQPPRIH